MIQRRARARKWGAFAAVVITALALGVPVASADSDVAYGFTFRLTGLDDTTLTGVNDLGWQLASPLTDTTSYRAANLNQYLAGSLCRAAASDYNEALGVSLPDISAIQLAIGAYAVLGCKARFVLFPTDPLFPNDPVLPPNPIRVFTPVG